MNEIAKVEEAPDVEDEVARGMRNYHTMRDERNRYVKDIESLKNFTTRLEAKNDELNATNNRLTSELEYYRAMAIEAKTHLHIIQGHINGAVENLKSLKDEVKTGEKM